MRCRFNKLPNNKVNNFINKIIKNENMNISGDVVKKIILNFNNDLRSIINYLQCNQNNVDNFKLIDDIFWKNLTKILKEKIFIEVNEYIQKISLEYHYEQKMLLKEYINYLITKKIILSKKFFLFVENAYHNLDIDSKSYCNYIIFNIIIYLKEL